LATPDQTETIPRNIWPGIWLMVTPSRNWLGDPWKNLKTEREAVRSIYEQGDDWKKTLRRCEEKATQIATEVIERVRRKVGF